MNSREVVVSAVFAALYAVGVISLAGTSFLPFQVRFADMLLPLSMLFGWPAIVGVTIGTIVANTVGDAILGPIFPVDVIGGSIANLIGCSAAFAIARRFSGYNLYRALFAGSWIINLTVTFIVGSYLYLFLPFGLASIEAGWLGVFLGSVVAINIMGFGLTMAIYRRSLVSPQIKHLLRL